MFVRGDVLGYSPELKVELD